MDDDFDIMKSKMGIFLQELMKHIPENKPETRGKTVEYKCPLCGGTVRCSRAKYNGHLHAKCNDCRFGIFE